MYSYEEIKPQLFTESGVKVLIQMRDSVDKKIEFAGAVTSGAAMDGVGGGDAWLMLAALDYLVETGELVDLTKDMEVVGQRRVFVRKQ